MALEYQSLQGREQAVSDIYALISEERCPDIFLVGNHGTGKHYVLLKLAGAVEKSKNVTVLTFAGDQIVEFGRKYKTRKTECDFSASLYIGISWTTSEKESSKVDYILNCFKGFKGKKLLFMISDLNKQSGEIKDLVFMIAKNKEFIEKQIGKRITFLITAQQGEMMELPQFTSVTLLPYNLLDIKKYVRDILNFDLDDNDSDAKFKKLFEICGSDLDLVNLIYRNVLENNLGYSQSLNELVKLRLQMLKKEGEQRTIPPKDLEEIILTCSLSAEFFSRIEISKATHRPEELVNNSFQLFVEEYLFDRKGSDLFDFVSPEIKHILEQDMLVKHNTRLLDYYNYLTKYRIDEYYLRAYYLIKYEGCISENSFCLLILATSQAFMFSDKWVEEKISSILQNYGTKEDLDIYRNICDAYSQHRSGKYRSSNMLLENVPRYLLGEVAQAELDRLLFRNYYLLHDASSFTFRSVLQSIKKYITDPPRLRPVEGVETSAEIILNLRIIYDIAPYILDSENDYEFFQILYDRSNTILRQEYNCNYRAKTIEYIKNVFNRKAFLFANPMHAMPYYEEAKNFFMKYHIWDEYCMTLVCQAGTCLACHEYKYAEDLCLKAQEVSNANHIKLEKPEKLKNNLLIAQFLSYEENAYNKPAFVEKQAANTAACLEQLAVGPACGTKHVLLTNAASLYLYAGDFKKYRIVKQKLEKSLNCADVAEVKDETINDFYRYYFAWFEIYYNIKKERWSACEKTLQQIDKFIPALFKRQENLWTKKNEAVRQLIRAKQNVSSREFCLNLVKDSHHAKELALFYHRGLMLSDIQYTSFD